ncbi:MAG: hypothetical protein JRJ70_16800 [Deltaproteobacteria bacterium]|nr:hypothetical protein [Deltaproteobacteria bacterium]
MRKPLHDASTSIDHTTCTADWDLSRELAQQSDIPIILAGGLSPENVFEALERKLREREAALPANCASPRQSMAIEALEKEIALLPAFF